MEDKKELTEDYKRIEEALYQFFVDAQNRMGISLNTERMNALRRTAFIHAKALFLATVNETNRICGKLREAMVEGLTAVDTRLKAIEERLEKIEEKKAKAKKIEPN